MLASLILALARWLGRMPLGVLRALGRTGGAAALRLAPAWRRKARAQLASAAASAPELRDPGLLAASARHAGQLAAEAPFVWFGGDARLRARVACDDLAVFDAAEAAGRGIVFLTPHLGNFEMTARWYAGRAPITVLYKPPRQPALRPLLEASRNHGGLRAAPATLAGVRTLLRALRRGEAVGLLPDQVPSDGEGAWAPFLGRPAWTMTLPQRLVEMTGARVVLAVGECLPGAAGWRLHAEPMDELPTPEALNAAMERLVRRFPAQYLWSYNRHKVPAGVVPPPDGAAR